MRSFSPTPGFVVAATSSGVGKTTTTAAICSILRDAGYAVQPFKTGPDYVDPTYLTLAAGRPCRNLDGFPNPGLMPYFYKTACAARGGAQIAVVEGVMGMYDGLGPDGLYSTAWLARTLDLPVVLLVDAKAAATSVAAVVKGFASLEPLAPRVAGVIANRVSGAGHAELIASALERFVGVPLVGWIPHLRDEAFASRHLGLVPALEREGVRETLDRFAAAVREHLDIEKLVRLATRPQSTDIEPTLPEPIRKGDGSPLRVAVATDDAFCFQYDGNWELLARLGAEIVRTSPLADAALPAGTDLLILSGGYPEEFARALSRNRSYIESVRTFGKIGRIYAECGGMMYLAKAITYRGKRWQEVGLLDGEAVMTDRLQPFGYVEATALRDNLLFSAGETVRAHEFHYSKIEGPEPEAFSVEKAARRETRWRDGFTNGGTRLLGTYLHIDFHSCPAAAARMLRNAAGEGK